MPSSVIEKSRFLLFPLSALYGAMVEIRNLYYDRGWLPSAPLPAPAIAVGNLTVGGAGKTPVTAYLARMLEKAGKKVVILALGYRRRSGRTVLINQNTLHRWPPQKTGDEPRILARALVKGTVAVGWNRYRVAWNTFSELQPDVYLLDDAYQYRQVQRTLDVLVMDGPSVGRKEYVIPAGRLREPFSQMRRAHLIWITRTEQMDCTRKDAFRWIRCWSRAPVVFSSFVPEKLVRVDGSHPQPATVLQGRRVFAFCGIARPTSFVDTLKAMRAHVVGQRFFLDHHWFTDGELDRIREEAEKRGAEWIVTTEKDAVRFTTSQKQRSRDIFFLEIKLKVENEEVLKNLLKNSGIW